MHTTSLISALGILIIFFSLESFLRYGAEARSIKTDEKDKKSTSYLGLIFAVNFLLLECGFLLDDNGIGLVFHNLNLAFLGNLIMLTGLFLRVFATRTLKEYYTRTLKIQSNQKIIDFGLYHYIRHPGYLGVILIWLGAGLSSDSYIVLTLVSITTLLVYHYRMNSEEVMLTDAFGDDYKNYIKRTWRIIPRVY